MKFTVLKSSLILILMILSSLSFASAYLGGGKITMLQSYGYSGWLIKTDAANNANSGQCSPESSITLLSPNAPNYDQIFSLILAAYATGKQLNINVNGCSDNGNYNKFSFIYSTWNN